MNPASQSVVVSMIEVLEKADVAYYSGAAPLMSDESYDRLRESALRLDPTNPYFAKVGSPVVSGTKVQHTQAMYSLDKAVDKASFASWYNTVVANFGVQNFVVSEKLDGISISLRYHQGALVQAVTRGDGDVGEDITGNVRLMKGVPLQGVQGPNSPFFTGMVRGEIICLKSDHAKYFSGQSNPRNTAAGVAKRQSDNADCKHLTVLVYELNCETKQKSFAFLKQMGFLTPNAISTDSLEALQMFYEHYVESHRATLDYDIDGLVIEIDSRDIYDQMGVSSGKPLGAIAYKFPAETASTTLRNIRWQVGATGRVTPVAEFDPVQLAGVVVKQATLHNVAYIEALALAGASQDPLLAVGDQILVSRRNDVIPAVEQLLIPSLGGDLLYLPLGCPCCGTTLQKVGEYLICEGTDCSAQAVGALQRWVQKLGVLYVGDQLLETLYVHGLVKDVADLYDWDPLQASRLAMDGRVVGASAYKAFDNLQAKKDLDLHVLLGSIGLSPLIGRSMVKMIIDSGFDTLDKLKSANLHQISSIPGIGSTKALAFVDGLERKLPLIEKLFRNGIRIKQKASGSMSGKSMCQTGFRDAAMVAAFEAAGGTVKSSVGSGLTYLVCVDKTATSGKLDKARKLGIQLVDAEEMRQWLKQ